MDSLVISLAPVAIIAAYIWFRDKYEREPFVLLLLSLVAGALIVIPVMAVESVLSTAGENFAGWAETAWTAQHLRDWNDFHQRLLQSQNWLTHLGIQPGPIPS